MTNNLIIETLEDLTAEDLEAVWTLANIRVKATYSRAEWDAAVTLASLRTSNQTKAPTADITTTELSNQSPAEVLEAAAILINMRGNTEYSPAEWDVAIALVRLKASDNVNIIDCLESPQSTITNESEGSDTNPKNNSSGTTIESEDSGIISPLLRHRVTRAMGIKMTTAAAYDMSYHPLDDVIKVVTKRGGKKR